MVRSRKAFMSSCSICLGDNLNQSQHYYTKLIRANGGKVTVNVKAATHLIVGESSEKNPKQQEAVKHGVQIVTEKWLEDSIAQQKLLEEDKYEPGKESEETKPMEEEEEEEARYDPEITWENFRKKVKRVSQYLPKTFEKIVQDKDTSDIIFIIEESGQGKKEKGDEEEEAEQKTPRKKAKRGSESGKEEEVESKGHGVESENVVYAHQAVLFSQSQVLKNLVEESKEEKEGRKVVRISNVPFELFEALIHTIYTGEIVESPDSPESNLALLDVCQRFGFEQLSFYLESAFWNSKNICMLYQIAFQNPRNANLEKIRFETLSDFLNKHISAAVKSDSFRLLSKPCLLSILESDKLEINELDLFLAVLQWIDFQVGKEKETEQSSKRQELHSELLPKIRFPLIGAQDLLLHVEPLKIVPKELLLEAYRHLAVDLSPWEWSSPRCFPRGLSKPRWMKEVWFNQIKRWMQEVTHQRLSFGKVLFSTEKDPKTNEKFHEKCDKQGPTIVVIKSGNFIFGAFTTHSWGTSNGYSADKHAFIFSLTNGAKRKAVRFIPVTNKKLAVYDTSSSGPAWGGGHDLVANLGGQCYSSLGHTYQIPKGHTYGDHSSATFLAGKKDFTIDSLIVFQARKIESKTSESK